MWSLFFKVKRDERTNTERQLKHQQDERTAVWGAGGETEPPAPGHPLRWETSTSTHLSTHNDTRAQVSHQRGHLTAAVSDVRNHLQPVSIREYLESNVKKVKGGEGVISSHLSGPTYKI